MRAADFIDIIQTVGMQFVFKLPQIRTTPMERSFTEHAGSVARLLDRRHPGWCGFGQFVRTVVPHSGVVGITARSQGNSCRQTDGRIGYAVGEPNPVARDSIDVGGPYPTSTATKRICAELIAHNKKNVALHRVARLTRTTKRKPTSSFAVRIDRISQLAKFCVSL